MWIRQLWQITKTVKPPPLNDKLQAHWKAVASAGLPKIENQRPSKCPSPPKKLEVKKADVFAYAANPAVNKLKYDSHGVPYPPALPDLPLLPLLDVEPEKDTRISLSLA